MESSSRNILIPAAGKSLRFGIAGYSGPKATLDIDWMGQTKTMIRWVLDSIPAHQHVHIVVLREHLIAMEKAVHGNQHRISFIDLDEPTRGQSDTILQGLVQSGIEGPVSVTNCDVCTAPRNWGSLWTEGHAVLLHRDRRPRTAPPIFSYVDSPALPTAFAEKMRITDWAQSGAWQFQDAAVLRGLLEKQLSEDTDELYLSRVLGWLRPHLAGIVSDRTWDLGTPDLVTAVGGRIVA